MYRVCCVLTSINTSQSIRPYGLQGANTNFKLVHVTSCLASVQGFDRSHELVHTPELREYEDDNPSSLITACGYYKDLRASIDNEMPYAMGTASAASSVSLSFSLTACKPGIPTHTAP